MPSPMHSKLFGRQADSHLRLEQGASISEALQHRVNAIQFQPSRGFLKDQDGQNAPPRGRWVLCKLFVEQAVSSTQVAEAYRNYS